MTALAFPPRLLPAPKAAHYLGVSESKLRTLPIPRKKDGGNVLYDRIDLDIYADQVPYDPNGPAPNLDKAPESVQPSGPKKWARR